MSLLALPALVIIIVVFIFVGVFWYRTIRKSGIDDVMDLPSIQIENTKLLNKLLKKKLEKSEDLSAEEMQLIEKLRSEGK